MTREQALDLLHQHIKTPNLLKHLLATEALMKALARKYGENEEKWGLAGLLHDLDWDETRNNPQEHSLNAYEILKKTDLDPEVAEAIKIHNPIHGIVPVTRLDQALYCCESMTGFLVACALVQPDKKLALLTRESVLKKFKSPSFAAGTKRDLILRAERMLGLKLEELVDICLGAMRAIAGELGL